MRITMLLVTRLLLMMILTMTLVTDEIDNVEDIMTKMSENMVISFSFLT